MVRKPKTTEKRSEPRVLGVWRIARFGERFEMQEYERRGGLDYVKMFVTAATNRQSNESTQFLAQLEELDHYYPEQRDAYEGRFWRLCRLTATQEGWLRGYLLGPSREPIGDAKLAARLHVDCKTMRATLAALRKVGLLEYVPCPDFSRPPQPKDEEPRESQEDARPQMPAKARSTQKGHKTSPAASIRDNSGKVRKSLEKSKTLLNEMAIDNSNSNSTGQLAKGQSETKTQAQAQAKGPNQGASQGQPPSAPTTTPPGPIPPQDVTTQGGRHLTPQGEGKPAITPPARVSSGPRIVPLRPDGDGVRMGDMVGRVVACSTEGYAVRAEDFAEEIFALLRAPFDRDSREGQRELGNYREALLKTIDAGLSASQIEEVLAKAKCDAAEIAKHRKRHYQNNGSPEQYWRFLFNKHLGARCGLPPARAGPVMTMG